MTESRLKIALRKHPELAELGTFWLAKYVGHVKPRTWQLYIKGQRNVPEQTLQRFDAAAKNMKALHECIKKI